MKSFKQFLEEALKAGQEAAAIPKSKHTYYGDVKGMAKPRKSASSSGDEELEEQQLKEITLSRIHGALQKGDPIGTVSPERGEMTKKQKKAAHKSIQKVLRRHSDAGMISFSGPHKGRYQYDDSAAPSKEGSYILRPGNHPKARENFHRLLKTIGKQFGQESVLKVKKKGKKATGAFHYTTGPKKGLVASQGRIRYNEPLKTGSGDTQLKGKSASFTVKD